MVRHYILLSSSYSQGIRIALDFVDLPIESNKLQSLINRIKKACGEDVAISLHSIEAKDAKWESVGETDAFFKDVRLISSEDAFIRLIKEDRDLRGLDVAKYILSVLDSCTHLKLEKLVYLCYAEYLCQTGGEKLFNDRIYAYRYGPVVKSVYDHYKKYAGNPIGKEFSGDPIEEDLPGRKDMLSARSRILFAEDGLKKLRSITETIEKYRSFTGGQLIDITHRKGTPWSYSDSTGSNKPIKDKLILEYHYKEDPSILS